MKKEREFYITCSKQIFKILGNSIVEAEEFSQNGDMEHEWFQQKYKGKKYIIYESTLDHKRILVLMYVLSYIFFKKLNQSHIQNGPTAAVNTQLNRSHYKYQ